MRMYRAAPSVEAQYHDSYAYECVCNIIMVHPRSVVAIFVFFLFFFLSINYSIYYIKVLSKVRLFQTSNILCLFLRFQNEPLHFLVELTQQ